MSMNIIIISGVSGAGKSISLRVLEDLGYFCIDNLPAELLPFLADKLPDRKRNIAVSIDGRSAEKQLDKFAQIIHKLRNQGATCKVVYIDADDSTLLKRYQETRRKHPLTDEGLSLREAFAKERQLLNPITQEVDMTIDTSSLTMQAFRKLIYDRLRPDQTSALSIFINSFGFKFGGLTDVDYLFDVRCLPNPYWEPGLSAFTGKDSQVVNFLEKQALTQKMLTDIGQFLTDWIPHYETVNRHYVNIGFGCTGGQHRSVYVAEQIAKRLAALGYDIKIRHRELG